MPAGNRRTYPTIRLQEEMSLSLGEFLVFSVEKFFRCLASEFMTMKGPATISGRIPLGWAVIA